MIMVLVTPKGPRRDLLDLLLIFRSGIANDEIIWKQGRFSNVRR
jgi:hypothetical protein